MEKEIGRGKQIQYLRAYLNKEFSGEYGKPFTYVQTKKVYDALGNHYDPKSKIEIDSVVGGVMGKRRVFDMDKFRPFDSSELELPPEAHSGLRAKLNEFGELVSVIMLFFGGIFFFSTKITGNVIGLSNATSSLIGGILILIGLIALGFWVRSKRRK